MSSNQSMTGHVPPLSYPATYQREMSPTWLNHAAVACGARPRDLAKPFRYLEIGCGRGYSTLIHAASHPEGTFYGCDIDPDAIASARDWAARCSVANVAFHAASFAEPAFATGPRFDFIALHGVYSWVCEETRAAIRTFLRDRLAPDGLCYVSYNAEPGWASELPLARLLREFAHDRRDLDQARRAIVDLRARGLSFFTAQPAAARAVDSWAGQPLGYLAHEYLSEACDAFWAVDVIAAMAEAGLTHIGSAMLRDRHEELLVDGDTARALGDLPTDRLRAIATDVALNRAHRRDMFAPKGASRDRAADGAELANLPIGCPDDPEQIPETITVPRGRIRFAPTFVHALRALMMHGALPLGEAVRTLSRNGDAGETVRNLLWLVAGGALSPFAHAGSAPKLARATAEGMLRLIASSEAPSWIASPAVGGGAPLDTEAAARAIESLQEGDNETSETRRLRRLGVL